MQQSHNTVEATAAVTAKLATIGRGARQEKKRQHHQTQK